MNKQLKEKIMEALGSVLPVTGIVLLLSMTIVPMPTGTLLLFLAGAILLIIGMGFFSLGADVSMLPMGKGIGVGLTKSKRIYFPLFACLLIGIMITIAEPDLQVLANQVNAIPNYTLILSVAFGVGIFLALSLLRIVLKISLNKLLIGLYALLFVVAYFAPDHYIAVAFDSGGVTTGPITVPFIMALGVGFSQLRSDKDSQDDSFGLIALCSIGPILSVLILSMFYSNTSANYSGQIIPSIQFTQDVVTQFTQALPHYMQEVMIAVFPICLLFLAFQLATRRFRGQSLLRILIGVLYTYIGLVTFLTGVNIGFMPAGNYIGSALAGSVFKYALIPVGMVIGYYIVVAEPAVHVLAKQVEDVSNGAVSQTLLFRTLSISMACSVGLSMIRVLFGVPVLYFLMPGYIIALALSFFVPKLYTAIAFDSGGVASGPMTATFLLPFAMGACSALGGDILMDAFGLVAMVAMTPLIAIQVLGFICSRKSIPDTLPIPQSADDILGEQMVYYYEEVPEA